MGPLRVVGGGLVYRNPKPYLKAIHAWHPCLAACPRTGDWLATFELGEAVESLDYARYSARSADQGATWSEPVAIFSDPVQPASHGSKVSLTADGTLVSLVTRLNRSRPSEGILSRETFGYTELDYLIQLSADFGHSWESAFDVHFPTEAPLEPCHAVVELADGRWMYPTSTCKTWAGELHDGFKAVAYFSDDRGRTWADSAVQFDGTSRGLRHFEQSIVELGDGRLVATAWEFHEESGTSNPNPLAVAATSRAPFEQRGASGINGETCKLLALPGGAGDRLLALYRRVDEPGLWAAACAVPAAGPLQVLAQAPVWQGSAANTVGGGGGGGDVDTLSQLKFGYPSFAALSGGDVACVWWCHEEDVYNIRWARLALALP
jgi:hypothetical protein